MIPKAILDEEDAALKPILAKIDAQEKRIAEVQAKIDSARGAKGSEKGKIVEQLKQISAMKGKAFADNKALIEQSKALRARQVALREVINATKEKLPYKRTQADDFISRNMEAINKQIAEGEAAIHSGTIPLREEKQKVAEVDALRRRKTEITQVGAQVEELKVVDQQLANLEVQLKDFNKGIDALKAQEAELKKELDSHKEGGSKFIDIGALIEQRKELQAGWKALADEHNAEFARLDEKRKKHFAEQRAKQQKEYEERQKAREAFYEEKRARREAYEKEKAKELPFEQEVDTCNHLLKYLEPILASTRDDAPAAPAAGDAKQPPAAAPAAAGKQAPAQKKAAAKKKKVGPNETLTHQWKYYQAFEKLSLQPPVKASELEASINAIRAKKAEYEAQQKAHAAAVKAKEEAEAKAKAVAAATAPAPAVAAAPVAAPATAAVPAEEPKKEEAAP